MEETVSAQALRESEELHRITLINMSDAVFITDDEGGFTFVCPNADVIFGYSQDEVRAMGRISQLLGCDLIDPRQLGPNGEVRNIEREIEVKGGVRRVLLVHIKRVSIKGGTVLYVCRDITERKEADQALRRNEERLKLALEAASAGTWDWHLPSGEMTWSAEAKRMFGIKDSVRPPSFDSFLDHVHVQDRARVAQTVADAMDRAASYETEFRVLGDDEIERWVMGRGKALRNGKPLRMLGVFVDVTERHHVERALQDLGGRLIHAHEDERMRLSQELHDDVGQRLALLSAELGMLERLGARETGILDQVKLIATHVEEIGSALRRLSHELHPAMLQVIGLPESIRRLCDETAAATRIVIRREIVTLPVALPGDLSLCLYRIAQEALHNVVKHSKASTVTVSLKSVDGEISLSVIDDGVSFDPSLNPNAGGLGLISMRERARLVHGHMMLTSKPGHGTTVDVRVPLFDVAGV
jgi:PAS domain S-box-containing protein